MNTPPRRYRALAGAAAGLSGIAVSHVLTSLLHARATPIEAVAETVIAITPGPVVEALISVVGTNDKPILVAGVTLAIIALGATAGLLATRSRLAGNLVFVAMGLVALAAAMSRPEFGAAAAIALGAGVATWLAVLAWLVEALPPARSATATGAGAGDAPEGPGEPVAGAGRRSFLVKAGAVVVAAGVATAGGRLLGRSRRAVETARSLLRLPVTRGTVPADAELDVAGTTSWRVPNNIFYRIDTALVLPVVDPVEWQLRIHGLVDRELTLTYDDLVGRGLTEAWVTLCCVSNRVGGDLIGNAFWSGVRVADLLAEAGVSAEADAVLQTSKDGWTCGTPLAALTDDRNALVAVAMNGEPLPVDHGFPVRMVVPGLYGFVSATKWLVDLEVTRFDRFRAYWTQRGWSALGPVKTQSRIEVPFNGNQVEAGPVRVGGHAWAQHTGIAAVEYRVDGGGWQQAELGGVPTDDTWVQWAATVDLAVGEHSLTVRATDKSGYTQTSVRTDVVPDGATGWHSVTFTAA